MARWLQSIGQVWHARNPQPGQRRLTVVTCTHRADAEAYAAQERRDHPDGNVSVSGQQGLWKVRRDTTPEDIAA